MLRFLWILLPLVLLAGRVMAQPPAEEEGEPTSAYELHMQNGVKLFKLGAWDGAIAEFEAAYAAEKRASPLINLALTYKKLARPAKALEVLEQALRDHRDTMPPDQVAAAEREIEEMSALLAYVTIRVTPSGAELYIDDRLHKDFKSGSVLKLSPGTRNLRAVARGFATVDIPVTVVSGRDNPPIELKLEATHAEVIVTAQHKDAAIEVNGNPVGRGLWKDMVRPGPVSVKVSHGDKVETLELSVAAGGRYTVNQNSDGELESNATAPIIEDDGDFKPALPEVLRGLYGTGTVAFLTAFANVRDFDAQNDDRFGVAVGLHVGYRVANWAGFEVMGQYSDIRISGNIPQQPGELTLVLQTLRAGVLLRVMHPGRAWIRFLGTGGGGAVIEWLEWHGEVSPHGIYFDEMGVGPFGQIDLGVEMEFSNVLLGIVVQHAVQGTKHFDLDNEENVFDTKPIFILGPSIRVGYGIW